MTFDHMREIGALRQRVAELEAEIADMRDSFDIRAENIWRAFDVTVYHSRVLAALASGRIMTRDQLMRLCLREETEDPRHVDCQIKRIRMRNTGLKITSVYGAGYVVEGESLVRLRAAMKGENHENLNRRTGPHKALGGMQAHGLS
jgi:DNA-binding winged helix-turn-helix (wHTH) protein